MENNSKSLYLIAGANGSGKSTLASELLPEEKLEFLNADDIAKEICPDNIESVRISAGKEVYKRLNTFFENGTSFAIETTLSGGNHVKTIKRAKELNYEVTLIYSFVDNPVMCIKRIRDDLFMEVITTLFLPEEYIDKTRTTSHTVDIEIEMHKYIKLFRQRGFFEIDMVNEPRSFMATRNITPTKLDKKVIKAMEKNLKSKMLFIESIADKDTVIFLVKKTTYDLLYPLLSNKYKIANDVIFEEYGKPYLPAGGGNNKIFRQKFRKCLEGINYNFETDFSYIRDIK
jgi:predicted kinase